LNRQEYFVNQYYEEISSPYNMLVKSAHLSGLALGFTSSVSQYAAAAAYTLGAYLVTNNLFGVDFQGIMIAFGAIIFGAQGLGQGASFMPDYGKARTAVASIFALLELVPTINNWDTKGDQISDDEFSSDIEFKGINFSYPTRKEAAVLNKIDLKISKGQRVGLVGSSGCGKSTVTQLIERFYDPDNGVITLSERDIKSLDLFWLRSQIGIVSQEPILFDLSIRENIAYGDNSRDEIPLSQIQEAAKKANIHDFIISLPDVNMTTTNLIIE
jgi:ABC-type multidrug transport system fused ATPase/permease subunit